MQEIVVIDGEITLENVLDGEVELEAITDLDPEVVIGTGGAVYPHYSGSYTVTPSGSVQTLDTSDKVMDDDVTIEAVQAGSATTPATIITADPTISVSSGGLITATVSKTQQITPTVQEGYVSAGTPGNVGVSGSNTEQLTVQSAQTIHPASTDQSIASGKYLTGAQTFKAVTVSGLTADKVLQGNVVKIGDADDDDRIMSVTGTASGGITPTGTKTITANGTGIDVYNYQYADVAVPNSYSASDEGKVVSNGALVAQTSQNIIVNGTYDTTLKNSVVVNVSGGGTEEAYPDDVMFIDYDGKVIYSYSAEEFAQLSELPANPSHTGLTAQGWNWTLADAKAYVAKYRILTIGAHYVTTDDKTHIVVSFDPYMPSAWLAFGLKIKTSVSGAVTIDWGDGTTTVTSGTGSKEYSHTYADFDEYEITLTRTSGKVTLEGKVTPTGSDTSRTIKEIHLGSNTTLEALLSSCYVLKTISIASDTTMSASTNFASCYNLKQITIPEGTNGFGSNRYNRVKYICLPKTFATTSTYFSGNSAVIRVSIPESITRIYQRFVSETGVTQIIVVPDTVTTIDTQGFFSMGGHTIFHFYPTTPPTLGNSNSVGGAFKIYVPYSADHSILDDYKTATNWTSVASLIEEEEPQ